MQKSFIRFPGGKTKLRSKILSYFNPIEYEYREPFIGGGSVYLGGEFPNAWINDIDYELYSLWKMVKEDPETLISYIDDHTSVLDHRKSPSKIKKALSLWKQIKADTNHKLYPAGYRFLFLSKTCFSGVVTGGPVGGTRQNGQYTLISRWSNNGTISAIRQAHEKLQDCKITNMSWEKVVTAPGRDVVLYLDPPYLDKGDQCYRHFFTDEDHRKLATAMAASSYRWLVSIDDNPMIRHIWTSCGIDDEQIIPISLMYSMDGNRTENRMGKELFIVDKETLARHEK